MRINLKAKLIVMMVAIIILANMIMGMISLRTSTAAMEQSINNNLNVLSEKVALEIQEMNEKEFTLIRGIANLPFIREGKDLHEICVQLNSVVNASPDKYENVSYYNLEGNSYSRDGVFHSSAAKDYYQAAIKGNEFVCDPFYSDVGKKVLQIYSVPVRGYDNKINGVVVAILYGDRITEVISKIDVGNGFHPVIMNQSNRQIIADANEHKIVVDDIVPGSDYGNILDEALSGKTASVIFDDPATQVKMAGSYRPIGGSTWSVFCAAPYDYFYGAMKNLKSLQLVGILISIVITFVVGYVIISLFIRPLFAIKTVITEIATGNADLTRRLPKSSDDEVGDVVNGFNQFVEKLQTIVRDIQTSNAKLDSAGMDLNASMDETSSSIKEIIQDIQSMHEQIYNQAGSVSETASAVNEIASNIESLERMIGIQSQGVSQASTTVEQMIGNITSVNSSMDKMADSFQKLAASAQTGATLQSNASERIEKIKTQSETLEEANQAIAAIAEQTNLLAMNAAIEAAHAGDAGKGFSVVADEIRKLSETSGEQSKTIGDQLTRIRESIEEMVDASQKSSLAFQDVTTRITDTDELVRQVKAAMEEQTIGSQQITEALHTMNDSTVEVRTASREMAEGNKQILAGVQNLQDGSGEMKSRMDQMSASASKISETGNALDRISEKLKESISDIGSEINQFKV